MAKKKKVDFDDSDDFDFEDGGDADQPADTIFEDASVEEVAEVEEVVTELDQGLADAQASEGGDELVTEVNEDLLVDNGAETVAVDDEVAVVDDEVAVVEEEPAVEVDEADAVVAVDQEDAGDADKDKGGDDKEVEEEEEEKPRAMVTMLTMVLAVLNILAACAFAFLMLMDFQKRQAWEYANLQHELALHGVLLEADSKEPTAAEQLRPPVKLNPAQIADQAKKRKLAVNLQEKDFPDVEEVLRTSIKPEILTDKVLQDMFSPLKGGLFSAQPVATLEKEVQKVRQDLDNDIQKAATTISEEAAKKPPAEQQQLLRKVLLPMAYTTEQVEEESKRIQNATDLSNLWVDAVQRRMYFELLRVLHVYRHWDLTTPVFENIVGAKQIQRDDLKKQVDARIDDLLKKKSQFLNGGDSTSYEKRGNIAFFLVAVNNLRKPLDGQLLYPREQDQTTKKYKTTRAEVVLGLVDYVSATNILGGVIKRIDELAKAKIADDREGTSYFHKKTQYYVPGFVEEYQEMLNRLVALVGDIEARKTRIAELKKQVDDTKVLLVKRQADYDATKDKLLEALKVTNELVDELKKLQTQLFAAQKELAGIMELNQQMEREIAEAEKKLIASAPK